MRIDQSTPVRQLPTNAAPLEQNLSKTDWKTHALVVLGYVLVAIGITLAFCAPYIAFTVQPMLAVTSPVLPIALGVLGIQYASEPLSSVKVAAPVKATNVVAVPPIGIRREGNNCWVNASLQILFNVPAFKKVMENLLEKFDPELSALREEYKTYKEGGQVNSQKIRVWLHSQSPRQIPLDPTVQGMYDKCLGPALLQSGYSLPTEIRYLVIWEGENAKTERIPPFPTFTLNIDGSFTEDNTNHDVTRALKNYFYNKEYNSFKDESGRAIEQTSVTYLSFDKTPEDFSISVDLSIVGEKNRSYDKRKAEKKLHGAMEVSLPNQFGSNANYYCDGFIRHTGNGTNSGHYIAYFLKDGIWWEASDLDVRPMKLKEVNEKLALASYIHYQKAPSTQALT